MAMFPRAWCWTSLAGEHLTDRRFSALRMAHARYDSNFECARSSCTARRSCPCSTARDEWRCLMMMVLYGRLPCGKRVFEVLTPRHSNCGLISGLLVQPGGKPAAGLDGLSRGRCSSPHEGFALGSPVHHSALPDPRSDRSTITSSTRLTHSLRHPLL